MKTLHVNKYPDDYINKIICGDCLEVMKQMPDKCVDLVLTDPPYGVSWQSNWSEEKRDKIANDDYLFFDWIDLLPDAPTYIFTKWTVLCEWTNALRQRKYNIFDVIVWDKLSHGSGNLFSWAPTYELIIYCGKGKCPRLLGNRPQNVLRHWRVDGGATGISSGRLLSHPAEKPVSLFKDIIQKHECQTIFDPFLGSGTTAVACKELGRNFIGIEKEPKYCAIAEERLRILDMQPKLL